MKAYAEKYFKQNKSRTELRPEAFLKETRQIFIKIWQKVKFLDPFNHTDV